MRILDKTDARRLFRNRLQNYVHSGDPGHVEAFDGSAVTLLELCRVLLNDDEPFPWHFRHDMIKLCGHQHMIWSREERSYGDAAQVIQFRLGCADTGRADGPALWVSHTLKFRRQGRSS